MGETYPYFLKNKIGLTINTKKKLTKQHILDNLENSSLNQWNAGVWN